MDVGNSIALQITNNEAMTQFLVSVTILYHISMAAGA